MPTRATQCALVPLVLLRLFLLTLGTSDGTRELAYDENHDGARAIFEKHFLPAVHGPTAAERVLIVDVGANDGRWSQNMLAHCKRLRGLKLARTSTEIHMIEPQPRFTEQLRTIASAWPGASVHAKAAWKDGKSNQTFFLSRLSIMASLKKVVALHAGHVRRGPKNISVPTLGLASFMARRVPRTPNASATYVALKLDVEGAEFELLPHLVASGVLCRAHLILVEWHLNSLPPAERLAGLGLRLSLAATLRHGCVPHGPVVVNEGAPTNNWEQAVPGLWDVALLHNGTPVPGMAPSRLVRRWGALHDDPVTVKMHVP